MQCSIPEFGVLIIVAVPVVVLVLYKYLLEQKSLLLLDQSLQLVGRQKLLHLLRSHHCQEDLQKEEEEG